MAENTPVNQQQRGMSVERAAITVECDEDSPVDCESVILVPEIAVSEPGYIKTMTVKGGAHAKHEYHAMAQMAYFQSQDEELIPRVVTAPVIASKDNEMEQITAGMVILRKLSGEIQVLVHDGQNRKKLFETAHRYCTRWVRLDI